MTVAKGPRQRRQLGQYMPLSAIASRVSVIAGLPRAGVGITNKTAGRRSPGVSNVTSSIMGDLLSLPSGFRS